MSDHAIVTDDLTKRYGSTVAVDGIDLTVESGAIYGFLGPNGAGKSTTIDVFMDYARPTAGSVRVLDMHPREDVVAVHERVGIVPDRFDTYDGRSGRDHVALVVDTKRSGDDPDRLLERVGLADAAGDAVDTYSQGMEQRLALAMALVGDPDLLVLDEPFTGLDPYGVRMVRDVVEEANDEGTTVFFSSHVLGQVELVCDRIGVLHDGNLVAEGPLEALRRDAGLDADASVEDMFLAYTDEPVTDAADGGDD